MSKSLHVEGTGSTTMTVQVTGFLRGSSLVGAFGLIIIGFVMLVMSFLTSPAIGLRAIEVFLSAATLLAGGLLLWAAMTNKRNPVVVSLWPGEIALAAVFFYLGVAMPVFHEGQATVSTAVIQFSCVLLGLFLGSWALALSGASKGVRQIGSIRPAASLRDGVILIVGTILLAIALSQLAGNALKPPQWNWISFLGITIPGMVLLILREIIKEGSENWVGLRQVLRTLVIESLLVIGLAVMLYGSYSNLTLGANGFQLVVKGNAAGLTLWIVAALFLLVGRGIFKGVFLQQRRRLPFQVVSQFLYVLAVVAFIYGERSVLTGKPPTVLIGGAAPLATLILLGGFFMLVVGRILGLGRVVVQEGQ